MNHIAAIISTVAFSLTLSATAQEPTDTVKVLENANSVLVTKEGELTRIYAEELTPEGEEDVFLYEVKVKNDSSVYDMPDDWEMSIPFLYKEEKRPGSKLTRSIAVFSHTYWGWRFNYNDKANIKNCFELGFRNLISVNWTRGRHFPSTFSIGAGFGMRRYLAQDGFAFSKQGDNVIVRRTDGNEEVDFSRMDAWSIHVPVLFKQNIGGSCTFTIGGVVNLNTYVRAATKTSDGKRSHKEKYKGFQQNMLTADIMAAFSIGGIGVYATWSPFPMFKNGYGPELKAWSLGVDLFTF